jgi:hypothetical protein
MKVKIGPIKQSGSGGGLGGSLWFVSVWYQAVSRCEERGQVWIRDHGSAS